MCTYSLVVRMTISIVIHYAFYISAFQFIYFQLCKNRTVSARVKLFRNSMFLSVYPWQQYFFYSRRYCPILVAREQKLLFPSRQSKHFSLSILVSPCTSRKYKKNNNNPLRPCFPHDLITIKHLTCIHQIYINSITITFPLK